MPGTLPLAICCTATNTTLISWPLNSAGYVLQESLELSSPNWVDSTITPEVVGGRKQAILPATPGNHFFRLISR